MTAPHDNSTAAKALAAAGDHDSARDVAALDVAARGVERKLAATRSGLVERLIYGPAPDIAELRSGAELAQRVAGSQQAVVDAALGSLARGEAFTGDARLSAALRRTVAAEKAFGYTVPAAFGGAGASYGQLAAVEEALAGEWVGSARRRDLGAVDDRRRLAARLRRRAAAAHLPAARGRRPADGVRPDGGRRRRQREEDPGLRRRAGRRQLSPVRRRRCEQALDHERRARRLDRRRRAPRQERLELWPVRRRAAERRRRTRRDARLRVSLRAVARRGVRRELQLAAALPQFSDPQGQPHSGRRRRGAVLLPAHGPLHAGRDGGGLSAHAGARREPLRDAAQRRRRSRHSPRGAATELGPDPRRRAVGALAGVLVVAAGRRRRRSRGLARPHEVGVGGGRHRIDGGGRARARRPRISWRQPRQRRARQFAPLRRRRGRGRPDPHGHGARRHAALRRALLERTARRYRSREHRAATVPSCPRSGASCASAARRCCATRHAASLPQRACSCSRSSGCSAHGSRATPPSISCGCRCA